MRFVVLAFAIIFSGCSVLVEGNHITGSPYDVREVKAGVYDMIGEWPLWFDGAPEDFLTDVRIDFDEVVTTSYHGRVAGCTHGKLWVMVSTQDVNYVDVPLHRTAMWHELMHVALWNIEGDPDHDHEDGEGPWTDDHNEFVGILKERAKFRYESYNFLQ